MSIGDELSEFRQQTEAFWSKVGQKRKVVATDRKATFTRSGKTPKKLPGERGPHRTTKKRRRSSSK